MKFLILSILFLFISACSQQDGQNLSGINKTPRPAAPNEAEVAKYGYWPSQGAAHIKYQVIKETDPAFSVQYPRIENLKKSHPVAQAVNQSLVDPIQTFKDEARVYFNDSSAGVQAGTDIPWDYTVEWLGGRYDPSLWSLAFQIYVYQGGTQAHTYTHTINYDARNQKRVTMPDFFTDDAYQTVLLSEIKKQVASAKTTRWQNTNQAEAYDQDLDTQLQNLTLSKDLIEHWVLSEREGLPGFLIFLAPFSVGTKAEGSYEVFIALPLVETWLKPEYRNAFN